MKQITDQQMIREVLAFLNANATKQELEDIKESIANGDLESALQAAEWSILRYGEWIYNK